jgi:hypothetical protein
LEAADSNHQVKRASEMKCQTHGAQFMQHAIRPLAP